MILALLAAAGPASAQTPLPTPVPTQRRFPGRMEEGMGGPSSLSPTSPESLAADERLKAPLVPPNATQAQKGAYVYYQVCMACHGDRGQGLTDEWRAVFGPEDMNCYKSTCHGTNHPPQGFQLVSPDKIPAIFGPGKLARFQNAQQLHDYLVKTMPWWRPGYLQSEEYWEVTAYIMDHEGMLPKGVTLSEGNASVFLLRPVSPLPGDSRPAVLLLAGVLAMAALLVAYQRRHNL